ncbi:hypothetical protein ZIOFF_050168 [Zingiber officinale]|uniref:Ceramidase n=1 Tax=Zingiber officinale TaxID=94328 RepID=A0A8J5KTG3_ZINOF|nr:hypothetical protein ZIOFF_050168 [Zingiber officinale]
MGSVLNLALFFLRRQGMRLSSEFQRRHHGSAKEAMRGSRKLYAWGAAIVIFVVLMIVTPAIPQSQEYHDFADQRELFLGIPNTLNVISNIPFLFIGIAGFILCFHRNYFKLRLEGETWGWSIFFLGVAAVAFGSSYYHLKPNDATLVWDRLPMTVAFTSIMAIFIIERVDEKTGTTSIAPLVIAGIFSILYWRFFDDLRPYALVQFLPCIIIPLMAILIPPMYTHSSYWLWAAAFYLLAKVEEAEDKQIYKFTHQTLSGHTLKHLFAAMVPVFLALMLAKREIEPDRTSLLHKWRIQWITIRNKHFKAESIECEYSSVTTTDSKFCNIDKLYILIVDRKCGNELKRFVRGKCKVSGARVSV